MLWYCCIQSIKRNLAVQLNFRQLLHFIGVTSSRLKVKLTFSFMSLRQSLSESEVLREISRKTGVSAVAIEDRKKLVAAMTYFSGVRTWATFIDSSTWREQILPKLHDGAPRPKRSFLCKYVQASGGTGHASLKSGPDREAALGAYHYGRCMENYLNIQSRLQKDLGSDFSGYYKGYRQRGWEYIPNHAETKLVGDAARRGIIPCSDERSTFIITVSRNTCPGCTKWLAAASIRTGKYFVTVSPSKNVWSSIKYDPTKQIRVDQVEYRMYMPHPGGRVVIYESRIVGGDIQFKKTVRYVIEQLRRGPACKKGKKSRQKLLHRSQSKDE